MSFAHNHGTHQDLGRRRSLREGACARGTKASDPVRGQIRVRALGITLDAEAALNEQELRPEDGIGPSYWEGAVRYSGSAGGVGYLEMTGYDKPVRLE